MKLRQVAIGSLCALAPTFLAAQTASLTFPLDVLDWSYDDFMGAASGRLEAKTSASPQLTKNLQGSTGIEVNWVAPDCKVFRLVLPANINNDLEFVPFVNEGSGAYSTPWTNISSSAFQLKTLITSGVTSPNFSVFDGFNVTVASNNNGKVDISGAFDSTFSDPAGTVFKFRGVTLTGTINSSLNVTNRTVNPVLRMQMDFDNTVTSDPGAPMTIVDACPGAPSNLVATPLEGAAQISFQAGADNDSAITNYAYSVDGGAFSPLSSPDSQSPITIPNLTAGQTYSVVVRAINDIGEGADSVAINVSPHPDSDGDGVIDPQDAYPNDPTQWVMAVPATPAFGLLLLAGLLGLLGVRRLRL